MHKNTFIAVIAAVVCLCFSAFGEDAEPNISDLDEPALIAILESDASFSDKLAACRGLQIRGSKASVPALAALLTDPKLSHVARYALEPMSYPEAGKALRDAVASSVGPHKAGLAASLGYRGDAEAVPVLTPLLRDANPEVAQAAAAALGRIATPAAVDALFTCVADGPDAIGPAAAEGLLAAAQTLADTDKDAATAIYQRLLSPTWPTFVRTGAFYGLAEILPADAPDRIIEALRGDDPLFRNIAAAIVGETSDAEDTRTYAEVLPTLAPEAQEALVRGLMTRGDLLARPAIVDAAGAQDRAVRLAAAQALSLLGTADDVRMLADLLENEDEELADAANYALTMTRAEGVNEAMAAAVEPASPVVRAKLLELLAHRRAEQALPLAIASLTHEESGVRMAALRSLPPLARPEQAPELFAALDNAATSAERTAAERVLLAVAGRSGESFLPAVLDALDKAGVESSVALLRVVARIGGPRALQTAVAALNSEAEPLKETAVRVVSDWPTLDAVPHVLELAKSDDLSRHVLGLRGYVRMAGSAPSAEDKIEMLTNATELATRADEKKLVIGAWGALHATQSLEALTPALDDAEVQAEAATAVIAVATELLKNPGAKPAAAEALQLVVEKSEDEALKQRAKRALENAQ